MLRINEAEIIFFAKRKAFTEGDSLMLSMYYYNNNNM